LGSGRFSEALPPVIQLRPYQQRWVDDDSRFKLAVKGARIGFSFGTALEAVLDCISKPNTTWTVLSASKQQSKEFIEEGAAKIIKAMQAVAEIYEEPFADELGATDIQTIIVRMPNGSRIVALPANPRTARGYPGNAILDEFAHHEHSYSIWAAVSRQILLGHKIRILSTPNGRQGKFYDLAKEFGLTDGVAPPVNPFKKGPWSCHWVDVSLAIAEGCPINLAEARELYKGDLETMQQELFCIFLMAIGAWLPLELIAGAENDGASIDWPFGYVPVGPLFLGYDVGRSGDRSCLWLDEKIGDVKWTRMVRWFHNTPFFNKEKSGDQARLVFPVLKMITRGAMDSTGLGLGLYEFLDAECPGKLMGVNFGGSVPKEEKQGAKSVGAQSVRIKTDLAVRMKKEFEMGRNRIPQDNDIRAELMSIKKEFSGGAIRFDAPRIELETPAGVKTKAFAHGEAFWAKALCDLAAGGKSVSVDCMSSGMASASAMARQGGYGSEGRSSAFSAARGW
jgi:phage FluMu gp28-like protein